MINPTSKVLPATVLPAGYRAYSHTKHMNQRNIQHTSPVIEEKCILAGHF